jgi:ABC-2 type transport system permease protein
MTSLAKLLAKYVHLNVRAWLVYRVDLLIGTLAMIISDFLNVVFFWVIFQNITILNGWTFAQVLFFSGFGTVAFGIWNTFLVGAAPWRVGEHIRHGTLDRMLLRPVNPLLHLVFSGIPEKDGIPDIFIGGIVMSVAASMLGLAWTPQLVLALIALLISASVIIFSILLLISTLGFWVTKVDSLNDLFWMFNRFTEYPLNIYSQLFILAFTFVLPLGFIAYYPVQLFTGGNLWWYSLLTPLVALIMLGVAYAFWLFGLKNYASAGH